MHLTSHIPSAYPSKLLCPCLKRSMSILAAIKPWMTDFLITVSFSANILCSDENLGSMDVKEITRMQRVFGA